MLRKIRTPKKVKHIPFLPDGYKSIAMYKDEHRKYWIVTCSFIVGKERVVIMSNDGDYGYFDKASSIPKELITRLHKILKG
jgi:hypothetical protein